MNTKTFFAGCFIGIVALVIFFLQNHSSKPQKIKNLQEEVVILQQIKDIVLEKLIPDSIKNATRDASHNLMFADEGSNDYYSAKEKVWATQDYIKKSKPCRYIDSLLGAKTYDLIELSNR